MKTLLVVYLLLLVQPGQAWSQKMKLNNIEEVQIDVLQAKVNIEAKGAGPAELYYRSESADCFEEVGARGGTLVVRSKKKWFFNVNRCPVVIDLKVPAGVNIKINQAEGNIDLAGKVSTLNVVLISGKITSRLLTVSDMDVSLKSGEANLKINPANGFSGVFSGISASASLDLTQPVDVHFSSLSGNLWGSQKMVDPSSARKFSFRAVRGSLKVL